MFTMLTITIHWFTDHCEEQQEYAIHGVTKFYKAVLMLQVHI